jgi:hypothetical protein
MGWNDTVQIRGGVPLKGIIMPEYIRLYTVKDDKTKVLRVYVDEVGWLHIAKLPPDRDNIFISIEEIEIIIGHELEFHSERELTKDEVSGNN